MAVDIDRLDPAFRFSTEEANVIRWQFQNVLLVPSIRQALADASAEERMKIAETLQALAAELVEQREGV